MSDLRKYLDELKTLRFLHRKRSKQTDKMYTREIKRISTELIVKNKSDGKLTKPPYNGLNPMAKALPTATPVKVLPQGQKSHGSLASRPFQTREAVKPKPPQKETIKAYTL